MKCERFDKRNKNRTKISNFIVDFNNIKDQSARTPIVFIEELPDFKDSVLSIRSGDKNLSPFKEEEQLTLAEFKDIKTGNVEEQCKKFAESYKTTDNDKSGFKAPAECVKDGNNYKVVAKKAAGDGDKDDDGLSAGAIAGIVIACVVVVAAIIALLVYFLVIKKKKEKTSSTQGDSSIAN